MKLHRHPEGVTIATQKLNVRWKVEFPKISSPIKDSLELRVITTFNVDGRAKRRNIFEFLYLPGLVCCNLMNQKL